MFGAHAERVGDEHRGDYGVEPICRVLPIALSTYHDQDAKRRDGLRLPVRARRDQVLKPEIVGVFAENLASMVFGRCGGRCGVRGSILPDGRSSG